MRFPCFNSYFLEVTSHWRTFYKTHDIQGVFLKYAEILPTRFYMKPVARG
jgi:hypothetical protein